MNGNLLSQSHPRSAGAARRPPPSPRAVPPAAAGIPMFLARPVEPRVPLHPSILSHPSDARHEAEAAGAADSATRPGAPAPIVTPASAARPASPFHRAVARAARGAGPGTPLPDGTRAAMETRLGADLSGVRVHTGGDAARVARGIGANAFTVGRDVYFGENRWAPGSAAGDRLIAHELAHVVQQGPTGERVQCDLMMSLPSALGAFEIDMETQNAPAAPGMDGHIRFLPDPSGPYSAQIGLIQVVNVTDRAGATAPVGSPVDWTQVGAGEESGRNEASTTGLHGARRGFFVDAIYADLPRGSGRGPNYLEPGPEIPGHDEYGWLRSPTDLHAASLYDYPNSSIDTDFEFETVAKATDTQTVYGALHWGFEVRSGTVSGEYVHAASATSVEFEEALERFRGYYVHEPVVVYFDTDGDVPLPGEAAKLADVPDYLNRYPDVLISIDGYADERGSAAHNADLSLRRASAAEGLLLALGVGASRIDLLLGMGRTTTFAAGSNAGTWRANRRAVISFERTASTPIVMP